MNHCMLSMQVLTGIAPVQVSKAKVEVLTSGWRRATVANVPHDHGEYMARPAIQRVYWQSSPVSPSWCCVWDLCGICINQLPTCDGEAATCWHTFAAAAHCVQAC
jgi:hypothetical protein